MSRKEVPRAGLLKAALAGTISNAQGALAGIGEVKATDWDRVRMERVRMLARRHARQVWRYIDAHTSQGLDVSPGLIYPKPPRSARKRALVESVLSERFIQCVWRRP